jgi:hypothetical protein
VRRSIVPEDKKMIVIPAADNRAHSTDLSLQCISKIIVLRMIVTVGGRQKKHLRVAYDQDELPVLPPDHELARLYLQEVHELDHAGVDAMIMRSRFHVWITRIRPKAQSMKKPASRAEDARKSWGTRRWPPFLPTGWDQRRPSGPRPWICSGHSPSWAP